MIFDSLHSVVANNLVLTPFAMEHIEEKKKDAQNYVVNFIANSLFSVFLPEQSHLSHLVDFAQRTCSDCHYFEENLLPCVHLVAVWINHLGKESLLQMGGTVDGGSSMYKYLCGPPYWLDTLQASLAGVTVALPVSLESIPFPTPEKLLVQQKTTKTLGRPAIKRRASNMDSFQSGAKRKGGHISSKENVVNSQSPI